MKENEMDNLSPCSALVCLLLNISPNVKWEKYPTNSIQNSVVNSLPEPL